MRIANSRLRPLQWETFVRLRCRVKASSKENVREHGPRAAQRTWYSGKTEPTQVVKHYTTGERSVVDTLEERGLINQVTGDIAQLKDAVSKELVGAYVGIDPTAQSLHIGHLLPLMALFWMRLHRHPSVAVVGGGTALIGDPTGRLTSRERIHKNQHERNINQLKEQIRILWCNARELAIRHQPDLNTKRNLSIRDNRYWLNSVLLMNFLTRFGRVIRLGPMLTRDTVKLKMEKGDGMSFAEFCYPLLQAFDWWKLYQGVSSTSSTRERPNSHRERCQIQIGGADQYGNLVAGINVIKSMEKMDCEESELETTGDGGQQDVTVKAPKMSKASKASKASKDEGPIGFTVPLLTTASGEKFGKSAGNAVWLDHSLTLTFDLYGYFVRTPDTDVERLLKFFTFLPLQKIAVIMSEHIQQPEKRIAQHRLAWEVVALVHGLDEAEIVAANHRSVFAAKNLDLDAIPLGTDAAATLKAVDVFKMRANRIVSKAGFISSPTKALRLIESGGLYVAVPQGKTGAVEWTRLEKDSRGTPEWITGNGRMVFRLGKAKICSVQISSDAPLLSELGQGVETGGTKDVEQ